MSLHAVTLPRWGLAMEEGTLASWLVPEGAAVVAGEEIAEIETSKIANVLEAPAAGVLRRRVAAEGDVQPVGALIGVIADGGEADEVVDTFVCEHQARQATGEPTGPNALEPETSLVDGLPLRFLKVAAQRGQPRGSPLLLIHGFGGDYLNWRFNQAELASGRDVYAVDLPGHGGSSKDVGDGSIDALAARLEAWAKGQELGSIHVAGHSMGAAVALSLALAQPERVKSLTALAGVGFGGELNRSYLEGFLAASRRKDLQPVVEWLFADPTLVTRQMLDDLIAYKRLDGVAEALRNLIDNALTEAAIDRLRDRLSEVQAPMLAIFGALDQVLRGAPAEEMAGRMKRIEGAGHMPHVEMAAPVTASIAAFIGAHD